MTVHWRCGLVGAALIGTGCMLDLPDAPDPSPAPTRSQTAALIAPSEFVGRYDTNWGVLTIMLDRDGKTLVGYYGDPHEGRLAGSVVGSRFSFFWKGDKSQLEGHGYFERTTKGITGRWGYGADESGVGSWCGCPAQTRAKTVECSEAGVECR